MRYYLTARNLFRASSLRYNRPVNFDFARRTMASTPSEATPPPAQPSSGTSAASHEEVATGTDSKQPLPLPEPSGDGKTIDLSVGGEGVKLDHMGPLVVNQDGTMSRISNWAEMSEIERQNTLRILGKRNQQRLKQLREDAGATGETGQ